MKIRNLRKKLVRISALVLAMVLAFTSYCFATGENSGTTGGITNSTLAIGTKNLIEDLTKWLMVIAPILTILLVGYYLMRKSSSDEGDGRRWDNRVKIAIVCCIGVVVSSGLINVIIGYYK